VPLAYLNGRLVEEHDALVSAFDHGLVAGDGVFETVLVREGRTFALGRHLARLERSAEGLGIPLPDRGELAGAAKEVVAASGLRRARLRITVTSGPGPLGSDRGPGTPTVIIAVAPADLSAPSARVVLAPWPRNERGALAGLKTTSYAENVRALAHARAAGADEAVFGNLAGNCCEGTGSNLFLGVDGRLQTPPLSAGCLAGVTRALLLEHTSAEEADLPLSLLAGPGPLAEEAFLASTLRGVQPVSHVDGRPLAACPGPLTLAAQAAFEELLASTDEP
jgi:branched-chain amino acid aminotransferase